MMETYDTLKDRLIELDSSLLELITEVKDASGIVGSSMEGWETVCRNVLAQIAKENLRVAVVGPIKSGKSTVVNSFFKGDYLKRGAGVVTSMVTRARASDRLAATLYFKTWDDVNEDISRAVVMFPSVHFSTGQEEIDIRRDDIRQELSRGLAALPREYLIAKDSRNINSVLLANYLEGYETVRDIIGTDVVTMDFAKEQFARHRDFVGFDHLAVYLRDIRIGIDSVDMDPSIEIADCQGSDSPNPLHLARIQDYLLMTNLIVYVISSRTGVRQADINFLTMIDRMGIADNLLFIVNFDFNEHETLDGLDALVKRVKNELSLILPEPEIYVFSGLYNLFKAQGKEKISDKEARMLEQWELERAFVDFSDHGTKEFETSLHHILDRKRHSLQFKNHVGRLGLVASGLHQWAATNSDMLTKDEQSAAAVLEQTRQHRKKLEQAGELLKSTLEGSSRKLEKELKADIDRFFDARSGDVLPDVVNYIKSWSADLKKYESALAVSGFSNTFYMVFQEFKQGLDKFMAENINPRIMGFIKKLEVKISEHFEGVATSFDAMARDAITRYKTGMSDLGVTMNLGAGSEAIHAKDLDLVKKQSAVNLPPADFIMKYTNKIKTEAVMRLGIYSLGRMARRIFNRSAGNDRTGEIRALKHGISRLKADTEATVVFHFKSYRENIKFQYIFKLTEAVAESFYREILDRFRVYNADIALIREAVSEKRIDKGQLSELLNRIKQVAAETGNGVRRLAEDIETIEAGTENQRENRQEG